MIPLCKPSITDEEIKQVGEVLKSGWLAHGPKGEKFEEKFAEYVGVKEAVALNSCTSALELAIQVLDIKEEILVPSFTFVASANSVVTSGATPVFVDIDYDTCNINPEKVREAVTDKTEAVMPVHYAGQSCLMDEIMEIADENNLKVIEDSAETLGGTYKGKKTGTFGHLNCFSFYPTKNITTGEGGMITTNDSELAEELTVLKSHGISSSTYEREKKEKPWLRAAVEAGYNYRMCDVLAAIGLVQLEKIDELNKKRRDHAYFLNKHLDFENIDTPVELEDCLHVYQMYTIKVNDLDRTQFVKKLREKDIGASVHFDPPVHKQPFYEDFENRGGLEVTEKISERIVSLPMYPDMEKEDLEKIVVAVEDTIKELK